jgi:hypothetical protein
MCDIMRCEREDIVICYGVIREYIVYCGVVQCDEIRGDARRRMI